MATITVTPAVPAIEAPSSVVLNGCPFCAMPRVLTLAIEKGAFADPTPAPIPTPKPERKISAVTAARQLSALGTLLKRGIISEEKHAAEVAMLKAKLE